MQVRNALQQHVPGLEVLGSNYPPPPMSLLVARLIGGAQFLVIGTALAGEKLFSPAPAWAEVILRNKMNACAAAWFFGNMVHQNLMATGAFEVRGRPHNTGECAWRFRVCTTLAPSLTGGAPDAGFL